MIHVMSEPLKPLSHGLGPLFANLERRAQATIDLAARVRTALPGPEKDHVVSASYRDETLVVMADSAAWGARIRYAQHELLAALQAAGETQFTKVRVKVGRGKEE
jgi:hypothetical protein